MRQYYIRSKVQMQYLYKGICHSSYYIRTFRISAYMIYQLLFAYEFRTLKFCFLSAYIYTGS